MRIVEQAKREMHRVGIMPDDQQVMVDILERFFAQWNSGGAVFAMAPTLQRLIAGKPLAPLTGDDDEWTQVGEHDGAPILQNNRCFSVFKHKRKGIVEAYVLAVHGCPTITFPYVDNETSVSSPVVVIDHGN